MLGGGKERSDSVLENVGEVEEEGGAAIRRQPGEVPIGQARAGAAVPWDRLDRGRPRALAEPLQRGPGAEADGGGGGVQQPQESSRRPSDGTIGGKRAEQGPDHNSIKSVRSCVLETDNRTDGGAMGGGRGGGGGGRARSRASTPGFPRSQGREGPSPVPEQQGAALLGDALRAVRADHRQEPRPQAQGEGPGGGSGHDVASGGGEHGAVEVAQEVPRRRWGQGRLGLEL